MNFLFIIFDKFLKIKELNLKITIYLIKFVNFIYIYFYFILQLIKLIINYFHI